MLYISTLQTLIIGYVHLAAYKFKVSMVRSRVAKGIPVSDGSSLESLILPPVKFKVFTVMSNSSTSPTNLSHAFNIHGVKVNTESDVINYVRLSDEMLSLSLQYLYRKATAEVTKFNDKKYVSKIGELHDGILYYKSRIEEGQELRVVGGLDDILDLQSFTGVNFKVPVIDRYSPLAVSLASHLHYKVIKHQGAETVHRMSLQYVKIIGGRDLFKLIRKECIYCQKLLQRYVKQIMGPLADQQLSVSPIFYYTFADIWGPLRAYVPGYQRNTRAGSKSYDVYMLVFGCASTGMVNCQVMEGGKSTACVIDAMNRFFSETCVPKIFHIDKDGALMKAVLEGEINILSNSGIIAQERGMVFQTCPPQGHSAHGRIERRIKMLQEAFERSDLKMFRLHGLGWQTLAKRIEHDVNSIPLGFLTHREDFAPMLRILTPNFLKLNAGSNRSPCNLFSLPESGSDLTNRIEDAYKTFFKIWNDDYVPLIANRQRWHDSDVNLTENDVVYFKLRESPLSTRWLIGKIEGVTYSKDGKVRKVDVGYKFDTESGSREFRVVERPARECVKIWNIEDTTLLDDIRKVREASQAILGDGVLVSISGAIAHGCESSYGDCSSADNGIFHEDDVNVATYACNSVGSSDNYSIAAIDIGTHATAIYDAASSSFHVDTEIAVDDTMLDDDLDTMFFEIEDNNDKYDDIFDDILLLL